MELQYQLANGVWISCGERSEEFLSLCEVHNKLTRQEVISKLESGAMLRNDSSDWYSNCRKKPEPKIKIDVKKVKCSCGHSVPENLVMNASLGTSCPECYDRMSD